jgi:hypothetical protein
MPLRPIDILECEMTGYQSSHLAIEAGIEASPAYCKVGYNNKTDNVDFVFGIAQDPDDPAIGIPWMLARDGFNITKSWLKHCRDVIFPEMEGVYPILKNYVHKDNAASIRWLRWLGFTFYEVEVTFPNGEDAVAPVYLFVKLGGNPICVRPQQQ